MKIQVLPYVFKRIGLFLIIIWPIGHFLMGVFDPCQCDDLSGLPAYWNTILDISSLTGIVLFALSKKKEQAI